jgi:hypothetical protein
MLPDQLRLLISAYAAGDLSPRRRKAAARLLRHSDEARQLLKDLRSVQRRLRTLPRQELPAGFAERVLNALPERQPIIRPSLVGHSRGRRINRGTYVAAAAVFFAFATSIGLWAVSSRDAGGPSDVAVRPRAESNGTALVQATPTEKQSDDVDPPTQSAPPGDAVVKDAPPAPKPDTPTSQEPGPDPLGNVPLAAPDFVRVTPARLPLALAVRSLETADQRQKLQKELRKADAHHVDLFCRDSARGVERLQAVLRGRGVRLVVDTVVQEAVKRKVRGQYLVYCDDLTATEWADLFQRASVVDRRAEERKAGDSIFDHVVVVPFDAQDQKELTNLFGSELTQPETGRRSGAGAPDAPRPADATKGKSAIATAIGPWRTPAASKEVRQYLDMRRDRVPGTVGIALVVRSLTN